MTIASGLPQGVEHGTPSAYAYWMCRCEMCRAWKRAYKKKYYRRTPDAKRAEGRRAYARNQAKAKAKMKAWAEHSQEWRSAYMREYYVANRERIKANINAKARARNEHTAKTATHAGARWTDIEDRLVMDLDVSAVAMAKRLGRTFSAVANRRSLLKKRQEHTP